MTKAAFDKIAEGLNEALGIAHGSVPPEYPPLDLTPHPSHRLGEWRIVQGGLRRRDCACGAYELLDPTKRHGAGRHGVSDTLLRSCPAAAGADGGGAP